MADLHLLLGRGEAEAHGHAALGTCHLGENLDLGALVLHGR
jgi:hypothetical protein